MPTLAELMQDFYATQLGLEEPFPSLTDMQFAFFLGVKTGAIEIGGPGGTPEPGTYIPLSATLPIIRRSGGAWPVRDTWIEANIPGYGGPVQWDSTAEAGVLTGPADPELGDWWNDRP